MISDDFMDNCWCDGKYDVKCGAVILVADVSVTVWFYLHVLHGYWINPVSRPTST